jgi:signal transduction histidine kinase/ActR/RegA family two-component response regulator
MASENLGLDGDRQRRVLVHAPVAREGTLVAQILARAGIPHAICPTLYALASALADGVGALLLSEETLDEPGLDALTQAISDQPPWSDLPVLLVAGASRRHIGMHTLQRVRRLGNVTLLDRPIRSAVVLSAVESALRSRARQYELREVLIALHEAREQADATNRVKDEFLATLSHELRTPLNAMLGWASMLRSGQVHGPLVARAHEIIERNARAQHALVADLLDVSRIITGKLALTPSPVAVVPLLMAAIDSVAAAAEAKRVTITTHVEQNDTMVIGDRARLQQVFWNLLSNAVKFTPSGGGVDIDAHVDQDQVVISVSDTGIGIDPEFLPAVFDRFRQADSTTTRLHGGLGLGLAIVRHLIELHGGRIEVRSPGAGQGATFLVWLPQLASGSATASATSSRRLREPAAVDLHGVRVLVVDDDVDARELLGVILREAGARPTLVGSASEALDLITSGPLIDAIICDLVIPDQDGYSLVTAIRAAATRRHRPVPAMVLTAYTGESDETRARKAGFAAFVPKPIDPYTLTRTFGRVLRRDRSRTA